MCKISVLMSIYNETVSDIEKAMRSMINQTFSDIEIIVVNDNPKRKDLKEYLESFGDERIRYVENETNIGLAMSMNVAAKIAKGAFLARMDSDDVSYVERLEKELHFIENNEFDYVCTYYEFVNENDEKLDRNIRRFNNKTVNELLPYTNTIHHPTVLMKREIFEAVGGYRDFPCAQDYDLWMRFYDKGYRVGILDEVLLSYRVREGSITNKKRVQQFYTQEYARKLSKERKWSDVDSYSIDSYNDYLKKNKVYDVEYIKETEQLRNLKGKKGRWYIGGLVFRNRYFRTYYINAIKSIIMEKILLQK